MRDTQSAGANDSKKTKCQKRPLMAVPTSTSETPQLPHRDCAAIMDMLHLTATGTAAYRRPDGIDVVPLTAMRD